MQTADASTLISAAISFAVATSASMNVHVSSSRLRLNGEFF